MKNKLLSMLLILAALVSMLSSCSIFSGNVASFGEATVVVENVDGSYDAFEVNLATVMNKKEGAKGVIEHLNQRNDRLYLEMIDSTYGAYVSAIGSIKESYADKKYVIVYTSVAADAYEGAPTIQYEGTTLYQAGVGLSGMSVEDGTIILFRLEVSPY